MAQVSDCNATVVGSMPIPQNELLLINTRTKTKALRSVPQLNTQCLEKYAGKWETECLNTRFPLSTLLHVEYQFL